MYQVGSGTIFVQVIGPVVALVSGPVAGPILT